MSDPWQASGRDADLLFSSVWPWSFRYSTHCNIGRPHPNPPCTHVTFAALMKAATILCKQIYGLVDDLQQTGFEPGTFSMGGK